LQAPSAWSVCGPVADSFACRRTLPDIVSRTREKLDAATRAAWLYYVAGKTQQEIAETLGISRPAAQRLIALAVEKNLIRVRVDHRLADCLTLAAELSARYGLTLCEIVPYDSDTEDELKRKLAVAGADVMERFLSTETPMVVAVSSGRTLKSAVAELGQFQRPQHRLVSMVGTVAQDGSSNRYDVALHISEKTAGKPFLLPAPLMADSEADCAQWCQHRLYQAVAGVCAQADVAFIGIGNMGPNCPQEEDGFITRAEVLDLMRHGAVAELLGRSIDDAGQPVVTTSQRRVTSLPMHAPPRHPTIGFAGGASKHGAVRAALRGGWLTGLVTDERCAQAVLAAG
jgi:DNA-binding transcriptional regulator LsrR (DeoR family)